LAAGNDKENTDPRSKIAPRVLDQQYSPPADTSSQSTFQNQQGAVLAEQQEPAIQQDPAPAVTVSTDPLSPPAQLRSPPAATSSNRCLPKYQKHQVVYYLNKKDGSKILCEIVQVGNDDAVPYYTIQFPDPDHSGEVREKGTEEDLVEEIWVNNQTIWTTHPHLKDVEK
jgi:hypothetical protein